MHDNSNLNYLFTNDSGKESFLSRLEIAQSWQLVESKVSAKNGKKKTFVTGALEWERWQLFFNLQCDELILFLGSASTISATNSIAVGEKRQISNRNAAKRRLFAPVKRNLPRSCITEWNYLNKLLFTCVEAKELRLSSHSVIHKAVKFTFSCKSIHDGWPLSVGTFLIQFCDFRWNF